ncbi:hypothetical protein EOL72_02050 [Candidatus Falkowbacteria bacterium]|jgi:hypothetical protein|nr:hypothetical protein [Candidatus Falkowbacteria bacterium]
MKGIKLCLALQGIMLLLYFILIYLGLIMAIILIVSDLPGAMFFLRPALEAFLAPLWLHLLFGLISLYGIVYFDSDENGEYLEEIISQKLTKK